MITYAKTILEINPQAEFNMTNPLDVSTIEWTEGTAPISKEDIQAKYDELVEKENNLPSVKASAKAKLIAGEPLTEEESNTIVL
jgi:hypothetical protein